MMPERRPGAGIASGVLTSSRARVPSRSAARSLAGALALVLALGLLVGLAPAAAAEPVNDEPPRISGTIRVGQVLTGSTGAWTPEPASYTFRWLRDGNPIKGADTRRHRLTPADRGHRIRFRVRAVAADQTTATASSEDTPAIKPGLLRVNRAPKLDGVPRWTRTLRVRLGAWQPWPRRFSVQWLRDGKRIPGATGRRFSPRTWDVNHRIRARVTGHRKGFAARRVGTPAKRIGYRVPVRRRVSYHVETRGRITTSMATFRRQAQQTLAHARGWRNGGTQFRRVRRGGGFTLVLAEARWVPRFSSACSAQWSCRVGRYVIINQTRWKHATSAWNGARGSLRGYRHMVVNHEVGHWLGRGHAGCPGRGRLAPVMMQQSKDLRGCRFNPFPTRGEL